MKYFLFKEQEDTVAGKIKFETDEDILNIIESTYADSIYKERVRGIFLCFRSLFPEEKPIEVWLRALNTILEVHEKHNNEP